MKPSLLLASAALVLSLGLLACGGVDLDEGMTRESSTLPYGVRVSVNPPMPTNTTITTIRINFTFDAKPKDELETGTAGSLLLAVRRSTDGEIISSAVDLHDYIEPGRNCNPASPCSRYLYWDFRFPVGTHRLEIVRLDRLESSATGTSGANPPPDALVAEVQIEVGDASACGNFTVRAKRNQSAHPVEVDFSLNQSGYRGTVLQRMVTTGPNLAAEGIGSASTCSGGNGATSCPGHHLLQFSSAAFGNSYTTNVWCNGALQGSITFLVAPDGSSISFSATTSPPSRRSSPEAMVSPVPLPASRGSPDGAPRSAGCRAAASP